MGIAGGGRNEVDPRFISLFAVISLVFPSDSTVLSIYKSIVSGHCQIFSEGIQHVAGLIMEITLKLYKVCLKKKRVTHVILALAAHYVNSRMFLDGDNRIASHAF